MGNPDRNPGQVDPAEGSREVIDRELKRTEQKPPKDKEKKPDDKG
jgi:hypothetical protein